MSTIEVSGVTTTGWPSKSVVSPTLVPAFMHGEPACRWKSDPAISKSGSSLIEFASWVVEVLYSARVYFVPPHSKSVVVA